MDNGTVRLTGVRCNPRLTAAAHMKMLWSYGPAATAATAARAGADRLLSQVAGPIDITTQGPLKRILAQHAPLSAGIWMQASALAAAPHGNHPDTVGF